MAESTSKELKDIGKAGAIAEEAILGVRTVQSFNGQDEMVERYRKELSKSGKHSVTSSFWSGFWGGLFFVVLFAFIGFGYLFGGYLIRIGVMSNPGDVFTVVMSMMIGAYFLGLISPHLMVLLNARVAATIIYKTIDRKPRIDVYSDAGKILMNVKGSIEFKDVHFRYPSRRDIKVLNGLNLSVEAGQTVALVGHSGCGKSTSVGLLTRLYEAESGKVTLDDCDVRDLNLEWLRNTIGVVQQEPALFNDTIEENLRIGCPGISESDMIQVCKMANAHDFIMKLPKGYSTLIGDGGVQLSGGQKQRIAIARTLARNPRVLLLDEATSALDAQSESIVQKALDNASEGRTTIVIAHRLSTIRNAHKILVFDKGVIIEQGYFKVGHEVVLIIYDSFRILPTGAVSRKVSSELSGRDAFVRGARASDTYSRSSINVGPLEMITTTPESEEFAELIKLQMEQDGEITAGLIDIYKNAQGNYTKLFFAFLFAFIRGFELPVTSIAFGMVFKAMDLATIDDWLMQHQLVICLITFICIGLGTFLLHTISCLLFGKISENITRSFRTKAFKNILYQDAAYFDNPQHAPGKLITRLASDAPNVKAVGESVVDSRMMFVVFNMTAWLTCTIISMTSSWPVGVLGFILRHVYISKTTDSILGVVLVTLARIIHNKNITLMKKNPTNSVEIIENVRTVQLLTREQYFFNKYQKSSKIQKRNEICRGYIEGRYNIGQQAMVAVFMSCFGVMNAAAFFPEFVKAKSSAGMMFNIIERKPQTGDSSQGLKIRNLSFQKLRGNILFEDTHFVYPQRPHHPVMCGLQFTAQKGQTVALVGPSGSGKSTVISLLERFYDVTGGFVRFDGHEIRQISLDNLRTQMALVGQEPRLFAGTIKENICFGLSEVPDVAIKKALEMSNAADFVSKLPMIILFFKGLDTEVGEKGTQLSGGQKQRIAIARAVVRDPAVLLLDEATSALDSESERLGMLKMTRFISLSIFSLVTYCFREYGSHSYLMSIKGRYYQLIKRQDLTYRHRYDYSQTEKSAIIWAVAIGTILGTFPVNYCYIRYGASYDSLIQHFITRHREITTIYNLFSRWPFYISGMLSAVSTAFLPLGAHLGLTYLLLLRFIQGLAYAADFAAIGILCVRWAPIDQTGLFISVLTSFTPISTMVTNPLTGWLCENSLGWRSSYYIHATFGFIVFSLWLYFYNDDPQIHRNVSQKELGKIQKDKTKAHIERDSFVPYWMIVNMLGIVDFQEIIKNKVILVVWFNAFVEMVSVILLLTYAPLYFHNVLGYDVGSTGFLVSLAASIHLPFKFLGGLISDHMTFFSERVKMCLFNSMALGLAGVFCGLIGVSPQEWPALGVTLFAAVITSMGMNPGGFYKCGTLSSRQYAHFVLATIQFMKCVALFVGPGMMALFVNDDHNHGQWSTVYFINAGLLILANCLFYPIATDKPASFTLITRAISEEDKATAMKQISGNDTCVAITITNKFKMF
uniref:Multidrug resistance protein 1 n=1 Tax=Heterorhabditis bacteriophora TaxID=37862 RepID=A0A1I7X6P2_HETBA